MIKVVLLGLGNVGMQLAQAFSNTKSIELVQVYNRSPIELKSITTTTLIHNIKEADIYIIAISDDAISEFSAQLQLKNKLVVHTSGSVSLQSLQCSANKGVFYPLQTFSKKHKVDFNEIPICIEAENKKDLALLKRLASSISDKVYQIDSEQRKYLHVSAVFTNNFVNQLYKIGYDICNQNKIPFEVLQPLIIESAKKIAMNNPANIQTGPAYRNDQKTISNHLELLAGDEKKIYKLLTESIQNTHGEKL